MYGHPSEWHWSPTFSCKISLLQGETMVGGSRHMAPWNWCLTSMDPAGALLQEVLHVLLKFAAIAAAGNVLDLSDSRVSPFTLLDLLPAVQVAAWFYFTRVELQHSFPAPRNSQTPQEFVLFFCTSCCVDLCTNELGIPAGVVARWGSQPGSMAVKLCPAIEAGSENRTVPIAWT